MESSGRGTIYSVSVMKRAPEVYAVAYVTLEEGPTMMTNIVDCDFDTVAIGQKVQVTWRPTRRGWQMAARPIRSSSRPRRTKRGRAAGAAPRPPEGPE